MSRSPAPMMFPCDLCGASVQMGPHRYEGKMLQHYKMFVCKICYEANWDGIAPHLEPIFERHLKAKGISMPSRNQKGWYPRDIT